MDRALLGYFFGYKLPIIIWHSRNHRRRARRTSDAPPVSMRLGSSKARSSPLQLNRCVTGFDPYTANLDHAHGQDPKRSPATPEPFPLEAHSVLPALRGRRTDRPGRPQRDNDIVEQYCNPNRSCLHNGHPDERPFPLFTTLRLRRDVKRRQIRQHGRSKSERYGHYSHALASLPHTA